MTRPDDISDVVHPAVYQVFWRPLIMYAASAMLDEAIDRLTVSSVEEDVDEAMSVPKSRRRKPNG